MRARARLTPAAALAACVALAVPAPASAWKPHGHLWAANQAIAPILGGGSSMSVGGATQPLDPRVAEAIRSFPRDYRGGVVGPDAFPDIPGGQGVIHPDAADWLEHLYAKGWEAYQRGEEVKFGNCPGYYAAKGTPAYVAGVYCEPSYVEHTWQEGRRALAFTYGFLTHAGEDVWGHSLVNHYAKGVFPELGSVLTNASDRQIAKRHIVVEGYVDKHTPATSQSIDAPTEFIYSAMIDDPEAARLGRGEFIELFERTRAWLVQERDSLNDEIESSSGGCGQHPVDCALRAYADAWIQDIDDGMRAYPALSLNLARDLFQGSSADITAAKSHIATFVRTHLLSMLGLPDFVGAAAEYLSEIEDALIDPLRPLLAPLIAAKNDFELWLVKRATGVDLREYKDYYDNPQKYIDSGSLGFAPGTHRSLDRLMGLARDGVSNVHEPMSLGDFSPMWNTVQTARLALLTRPALNTLFSVRRVALAPYQDDTIDNFVLGWPLSIDGQRQWSGGPHGSGGLVMWNDCDARHAVFMGIFRDWSADGADGLGNTPACPPVVHRADTRPVVSDPSPVLGQTLTCDRGEWEGNPSFAYAWYRMTGGSMARPTGVALRVKGAAYTVTARDLRSRLYCVVTATNGAGSTSEPSGATEPVTRAKARLTPVKPDRLAPRRLRQAR